MATLLVFYVGFISGKIGTFISSTSFWLKSWGFLNPDHNTCSDTWQSLAQLKYLVSFSYLIALAPPSKIIVSEASEEAKASTFVFYILENHQFFSFTIRNVSYWLIEKRFCLEAYTSYTRICSILKHYFIVFILVCIGDQTQVHKT